jgi:hypothetical protein
MGKFSGVGNDLLPDNSDSAFGADIPADTTQAADFGFERHPLPFPDDELHRAQINALGTISRAHLIPDDHPADKLGDDLDGLGAAGLETLGTAQTETGVGKDLTLVLGQLHHLPGAGSEADPAAFEAVIQGIGNQAAFSPAPVGFTFGQRRAGLRTLGGIQGDGRIEWTETMVVSQDSLGLAIVKESHGAGRAKMGANLAHDAEPGVDGDIKICFSWHKAHGLPWTDGGTNLTFETALFIQYQRNLIHVHGQREFQPGGRFTFLNRTKHAASKVF